MQFISPHQKHQLQDKILFSFKHWQKGNHEVGDRYQTYQGKYPMGKH